MKNFKLLPELLLRTPALSLNALWENLSKMQTPDQTAATLRQIFQDKNIQEALFLGSPNLHRRCLEWLEGKISDPKEAQKIARSLLRYYLRMSTRCTPFGLFAACSMGRWGKETAIEFPSEEKPLRNTRLDMHYLCALAQQLDGEESIQAYLKYYSNSSIYFFGDKIRYVEYYYQEGARRHQISAVSSSPYLLQLLERASKGASLDELAETLLEEDVSLEEAREFVREVIASQLLVSELEPAITGDDLLGQMLVILNRVKERSLNPSEKLRQSIEALTKVRRLLKDLDQGRVEDPYHTYRQIALELDQLGVAYDISKLFQVDMGRKSSLLQVRSQLAGSIRKGLEALNRLQSRRPPTNLQQFKDAFFKRYETKEVPLLQVLDNESGIGYLQSAGPGDVHPMIDDVQLANTVGDFSFQLDDRAAFLFKKLIKALEQGDFEIELKEEELKAFTPVWTDLPDTLSVMGVLVNQSDEANALETILIKSAGGSSAANLLGRFTRLDPAIDRFTRSISRHEQELHPNLIFAEIVHLPEARTGNILMRTQLRPYEIPFLAQSSVARDFQIALRDLCLSVKGDRLVLRSKKLNKEIIPRLSTAHNFSLSALPVYQFLCDLQFQQLPVGEGSRGGYMASGLAFDWGPLQRHFRFLPRVRYKNLILQRASWRHSKESYADLLKTQPQHRVISVRKWREKLKAPRRLVIADFDNELFIDLEDPACLALFFDVLKKRPEVRLLEFLFDPENAIVQDAKGKTYANEFIMAFARKEKSAVRTQKSDGADQKKEILNSPAIRRSFPIGGEWLYYKFYAGAQAGDELLADYTLPLAKELLAEGCIDHWFFIRYADPDLHLRLRFHLSDPAHIGRVAQKVNDYFSSAFEQKKIWKIQTDTYEREVERYGFTTMILSEQIFFRDSETVAAFLRDARQYEDPELLRWYFAMINIDYLLNGFQLNLKAKTNLLKNLKTGFAIEFNANNKSGTRQLSEKYRQNREAIEDIAKGDITAFPEELSELLRLKTKAIEPVCQEILAIKKAGRLSVDFHNFLGSHIHMLMNRLFRSQQRKYELVVYDMLYRAYQSAFIRREKRKNDEAV